MRRVPTMAWLLAALAILPASDPVPAQEASETPQTEQERETTGSPDAHDAVQRYRQGGDLAPKNPNTTSKPSPETPELHPVYRLRVGIRPRKSMLSKPIEVIEMGECVEMLETDAGWTRIRHGAVEGWIRKSDLSPKKRFDIREAAGKIDPDDPDAVRGGCGTAGPAKG